MRIEILQIFTREKPVTTNRLKYQILILKLPCSSPYHYNFSRQAQNACFFQMKSPAQNQVRWLFDLEHVWKRSFTQKQTPVHPLKHIAVRWNRYVSGNQVSLFNHGQHIGHNCDRAFPILEYYWSVQRQSTYNHLLSLSKMDHIQMWASPYVHFRFLWWSWSTQVGCCLTPGGG